MVKLYKVYTLYFLESIPPLSDLVCVLFRLATFSEINKMTIENIAIIFAPSLISHQPVPILPGINTLSAFDMQELIHKSLQSSLDIVEELIRYNEFLFLDERQV